MYSNGIKLYLTLLLLAFPSLFGFLFTEGVLAKYQSLINFTLDVILLGVGIFSIQDNKRTRTLILMFGIFIVLSLFTFIINIRELTLINYLNGFREFIPYFLFPIIFINLFQIVKRRTLIENFNKFLYIFLTIQIPVSFYQFLVNGSGDMVGGTLGNGNSGVLTFVIFLTTYYLMTQGFDSRNVLRSFMNKSYLLVFWIPAFINETKISFLLIILFFFMLTVFSISNLRKYLFAFILLIPLLYIFEAIYDKTTNKSFSNEILDPNFLEDYLTSDDEKYTDIPRFQKIAIFFTRFNSEEILFGKGFGQFKGGTTLKLTEFASSNQWLLSGSRPMLFFLLVQVGILGTVLFIVNWLILIRRPSKRRYVNYSKNLVIFTSVCFILIQFYNDSLRSLFFSGIIIFILIYATTGVPVIKKRNASK